MRFLLADDHAMIRENFRDYLNRSFDDVEIVEADTFDSLLMALESQGPFNLVISDLNMPGMQGTKSIKELVNSFPETPIAVFSGSFRNNEITEIISAGARGFIPKTVSSDTMGTAIKLILSGGAYIPKEALLKNEPAEPENIEGAAFRDALTRRERDVLSELVKGSSNKAIARALDIQDFTVKAHLQKVFEKLGVTNRSQAIIKAMDLGI